MSGEARGFTDDGTEFDGTTDGFDRVIPDAPSGRGRYHLTCVSFFTPGTITSLQIILWDRARDVQVGSLPSNSESSQLWAGDLRLPLDSEGNPLEVRVVNAGQSVDPAYLFIDGYSGV